MQAHQVQHRNETAAQQFTEEVITGILQDMLRNSYNFIDAKTHILEFYRPHSNISLPVSYEIILAKLDFAKVRNVFTPQFQTKITAAAETTKLNERKDSFLDDYSSLVYSRVANTTNSTTAAFRRWLACHEEQHCEPFLQDSNLVNALASSREEEFYAAHDGPLREAVTRYLQNNPAIADGYATQFLLAPSFMVMAANHIDDNALLYGMGASLLLCLVILRKPLARLNPLRLCSLFFTKSSTETPPPRNNNIFKAKI